MRLNLKEKRELRRFKSQLWYYDVLHREPGMNDYKLDIKFCWDIDDEQFQRKQGAALPRDGTDRIRAFENIRRNGSIPSKGGVGGRKFDLIARVDSTPGYQGTASLITSSLWAVLENPMLSIAEIRERIVQCVVSLGLPMKAGAYMDNGVDYFNELLQSNSDISLADFMYYINKIGDQSYDDALAHAISIFPDSLDQIALFALLALESSKASNTILSTYHLGIYKKQFLQYLRQDKYMSIDKGLVDFSVELLRRAIYPNSLTGLPTYQMMLREFKNTNPTSAVAAFLDRHERLLWR